MNEPAQFTTEVLDQNQAQQFLILGTAGHIDHGKTSLIRALTGAETDRLPEEKKRGITIELGFANLQIPPINFGIVDVPGHQKFVRTMLAGVNGIDVALLVVAADDSINLQTREHFEILKFLQVPKLVVALTKVDRVEESWCDLVEEEVRDLLTDSDYEDASIVRTSAIDGVGIDELKSELKLAGLAASEVRKSQQSLPFRMPIDRVFTRDGYGTVVTGSITHGEVNVGDTVQVVPDAHLEFRVRQIQSHDQALQKAVRGQRAALNLVGADVEALEKGGLLVQPGSMPTTQCLTVRFECDPGNRQLVKNHQVVRLHIGTGDVLGQIRFPTTNASEKAHSSEDGKLIHSTWAQIILKTPVAVNWNQRIVVRRVSPVQTIGVAQVVSVSISKQSRFSDRETEMLEKLMSASPIDRVEAAVYFSLDGRFDEKQIASQLQLDVSSVKSCLNDLELETIDVGNQTLVFHPSRLQDYIDVVQRGLTRLHDENPKRWLLEWDRVNGLFSFLPAPVLRWIFKQMNSEKRIRQSNRGIGLANRGPELTKNQQKRYEWILEQFLVGGLAPPTVKQCVEKADKNKEDVPELVKMAVDAGELVNVATDLVMADEVLQNAWKQLTEQFVATGMTVAEIRDVLEISRKITIPLCEYWDREGKLRRDGDLRFLTESTERDSTKE